MKKVEILRGLPKCDTEIRNEQMLLEKWQPIDLLDTGLLKAFNLLKKKNAVSVKCNILQHSKTRCTCSFLSLVACPVQNLREALAQPTSHENTHAYTYQVLLYYRACGLRFRTVLILFINSVLPSRI